MSSEMKLPKALRGKYVTRAAFTKMQMERDRLLSDIETLIYYGQNQMTIRQKYLDYFRKRDAFNEQLREMLQQQIKNSKMRE